MTDRQLDILRRASLSELAMIRVRWPGWLPSDLEAAAAVQCQADMRADRKVPKLSVRDVARVLEEQVCTANQIWPKGRKVRAA